VIVDHFARLAIVIERVDGEIPPPRVFLQAAEDVVAQHAAVLVLFRRLAVGGAKGRDLDGLRTQHHVHQAEAPPDHQRAAEQRLDLLRPRGRGDVEILRLDAEQDVAHRAAHHVGRVAALGQHVADLERAVAHRVAGDPVACRRHALQARGVQAEHAADEALDHLRNGLRVNFPERMFACLRRNREIDSDPIFIAGKSPASPGARPRRRACHRGRRRPGAKRARAAAGRCASRCRSCFVRSPPAPAPRRPAMR